MTGRTAFKIAGWVGVLVIAFVQGLAAQDRPAPADMDMTQMQQHQHAAHGGMSMQASSFIDEIVLHVTPGTTAEPNSTP
ncbi:MAG TPA: hypothetical protein VEW69_12145, partial [Alphaproteobacteria bacterium]|nr:hypothetical protein [Alphaproteobacteria bacterium]